MPGSEQGKHPNQCAIVPVPHTTYPAQAPKQVVHSSANKPYNLTPEMIFPCCVPLENPRSSLTLLRDALSSLCLPCPSFSTLPPSLSSTHRRLSCTRVLRLNSCLLHGKFLEHQRTVSWSGRFGDVTRSFILSMLRSKFTNSDAVTDRAERRREGRMESTPWLANFLEKPPHWNHKTNLEDIAARALEKRKQVQV